MRDFIRALSIFSPHAHWLLRITVAAVFLYHGLTKFADLHGAAYQLGLSLSLALFVAILESAGALLVLLGGLGPDWATRFGGLCHTIVMVGAIVTVHMPRWDGANGGVEFPLTLLAISLFFVFRGNTIMRTPLYGLDRTESRLR